MRRELNSLEGMFFLGTGRPSELAKRYACGFSLVEVLVSICVLSIGVIGAVSMQLAALRTTQQSSYQTSALQLASEMADAIRAQQLNGGDAGPSLSRIDYRAATDADPQPPGSLCFGNACDKQAFADFVVFEWKMRVKAALPEGRLRVCYDAHPWDEVKKELKWDCDESPGSGAPVMIKLGWQLKNPDGSLQTGRDGEAPPSVALAVTPA